MLKHWDDCCAQARTHTDPSLRARAPRAAARAYWPATPPPRHAPLLDRAQCGIWHLPLFYITHIHILYGIVIVMKFFIWLSNWFYFKAEYLCLFVLA